MGILEFLQGGQQRRASLDRSVAGLLSQYLGPTGIPQRLGLLAEANPVLSIERAGQAAQRVADPSQSGWGRVAATGDMLSNMAGVVAPVMAARSAGMPAVQAMEEALLGMSQRPASVGLLDFAGDESGALRLFHGSPYDFDRFSMDKIGTGEGAQAYGHGLYFAEAEGVANSYRKALAPGEDPIQAVTFRGAEMPIKNPETPTEQLILYMRQLGYTPKDAFKRAKKTFPPAMMKEIEGLSPSDFKTSIPDKYTGAGHMYEVSVNADPADFLDWDAPLAGQTSSIRDAVRSLAPRAGGMDAGQRLMDAISPNNATPFTSAADRARAAASAKLKEAGIPGIRYLDAGSRGAGDGSRNYVVFDENLITIVRKYGIAGAAAMLGLSQADIEGMMGQRPKGLIE